MKKSEAKTHWLSHFDGLLSLFISSCSRSFSFSLLEEHAAHLRSRGPRASRRGPGAQRRDNNGGKGVGNVDDELFVRRSMLDRRRSLSLLFLFFFRSSLEAPTEPALDAAATGEDSALVLQSGVVQFDCERGSGGRKRRRRFLLLPISVDLDPRRRRRHVRAPPVSYVAPLSTAVHRLKRLSLFSCLLTTAAAPTLAATESMPPAARATAAVGIAGFGLFTTGLLHWFVGPYVHELTWRDDGAGASIELTTLDVLGTKRKRSLPLSRVAAPPAGSIHPQATFSDSATGKLYYVDVDNFVSVASEAAGGGRRQRERAAALLAKLVVVEEEEMEATEAEEKGAKGQQ